jgi:hypothetical protein
MLWRVGHSGTWRRSTQTGNQHLLLLLLQDVFEIGRRYKIMNPEKMRSEFGKLMYMLMDSADTHVQVS